MTLPLTAADEARIILLRQKIADCLLALSKQKTRLREWQKELNGLRAREKDAEHARR